MEIERKFLVKELPDLSGLHRIRFERYYLSISDTIEERIQKTNKGYSYEKKVAIDNLSRSTEKKEISEGEFEKLKSSSSSAIIRDSYALSTNVSIKIYRGTYEGLVRVEVEFSSKDEADSYIPETWMGHEITNSPLGRDSRLLKLDADTFSKLITS